MSRRTKRLGNLLLREITEAILYEVSDPRLDFITIMSVDVSADMRNAIVYYSVLDTTEEKDEVEESLKKATGFIQHYVMERLEIKFVPRLHFKFDDTLVKAARIEKLIDNISHENEDGISENEAEPVDNESDSHDEIED